MTKKEPANGPDSSEQTEHTIRLSEQEFSSLKKVPGKTVRKIRYAYSSDGQLAEIDVFQDDLAGLVLADFEFKSRKKKEAFRPPDFCLVDVTQDDTIAGGMLCGKKYSDIENHLKDLGYTTLFLPRR